MKQELMRKLWVGATALSAALAGAPATPAHACGGFFCSAASPVNQAAEQIIFVDNPDGTVTAVIQIMYEGPSESFAWVLPVQGVPDVAVSSDAALDRLKQATNPQYQLNTVFEDGCNFLGGGVAAGAGGTGGGFPTADSGAPPVVVEASGNVGPYDYTVISVNDALEDPADVAVEWLTMYGYDVGAIGPAVLRPYLESGLNLLAFKLTKGNSTGSIRPVMITYESELPSIPITPTAVAANDDMGVLVWVLSDARAIPENYKGLELNEALIDWFNPNNNYNEVVTRAADEAGGQGFVTEYADQSSNFSETVFASWEEETWRQFASTVHTDPYAMINEAMSYWGGWDGFDDALAAAVTLPEGVTLQDFKLCMLCYQDDASFAISSSEFLRLMYDRVIKPMADTQALIDSRPYITRLYTTMSADEMTMDPIFDFNPDLPTVSNLHQADRITSCNSDEWRVPLAQGDVVFGDTFGVWPIDIDDQPAALRILQFSTRGDGTVVMDTSDMVSDLLGGSSMGGTDGGAGNGGAGGTGAPAGSGGTSGGAQNGTAGVSGSPGEGSGSGEGASASGCSVSGAGGTASLPALSLALGALLLRRRRKA